MSVVLLYFFSFSFFFSIFRSFKIQKMLLIRKKYKITIKKKKSVLTILMNFSQVQLLMNQIKPFSNLNLLSLYLIVSTDLFTLWLTTTELNLLLLIIFYLVLRVQTVLCNLFAPSISFTLDIPRVTNAPDGTEFVNVFLFITMSVFFFFTWKIRS